MQEEAIPDAELVENEIVDAEIVGDHAGFSRSNFIGPFSSAKVLVVGIIFLLLSSTIIYYLFDSDEIVETPSSSSNIWDFEKPDLTWYHFADAEDAWGNQEYNLEGRNIPFEAIGSYYGIGMSTFEP
ncbi:MAG: hypothetical protein OR994_08810, partial [Candidatus Poseidoniales archaeon]|nr:hypothetical protein [Candidatus Poseidoniales archaeon]